MSWGLVFGDVSGVGWYLVLHNIYTHPLPSKVGV